MKRGTTPTIKIHIGLDDYTDIDHVDFIFAQNCDENSKTKIKKFYPSDCVSFDESTGVYSISFTESETRVFRPNSTAFIDTRPVLKNGSILATEITEVDIYQTLFSGDD